MKGTIWLTQQPGRPIVAGHADDGQEGLQQQHLQMTASACEAAQYSTTLLGETHRVLAHTGTNSSLGYTNLFFLKHRVMFTQMNSTLIGSFAHSEQPWMTWQSEKPIMVHPTIDRLVETAPRASLLAETNIWHRCTVIMIALRCLVRTTALRSTITTLVQVELIWVIGCKGILPCLSDQRESHQSRHFFAGFASFWSPWFLHA